MIANSKHFYFDYKNGKYGYNTNPNRGADTFVPFSNAEQQTGSLTAHSGNIYSVECKNAIVVCVSPGNTNLYGVCVINDRQKIFETWTGGALLSFPYENGVLSAKAIAHIEYTYYSMHD